MSMFIPRNCFGLFWRVKLKRSRKCASRRRPACRRCRPSSSRQRTASSQLDVCQHISCRSSMDRTPTEYGPRQPCRTKAVEASIRSAFHDRQEAFVGRRSHVHFAVVALELSLQVGRLDVKLPNAKVGHASYRA
eukprot:2960895-Pleurochrysis_carterae.AAC.3